MERQSLRSSGVSVVCSQADLCKEPREIYQFLELHCIGQDHALFYEAYATYMELCKKHSKANEIYELGLRR